MWYRLPHRVWVANMSLTVCSLRCMHVSQEMAHSFDPGGLFGLVGNRKGESSFGILGRSELPLLYQRNWRIPNLLASSPNPQPKYYRYVSLLSTRFCMCRNASLGLNMLFFPEYNRVLFYVNGFLSGSTRKRSEVKGDLILMLELRANIPSRGELRMTIVLVTNEAFALSSSEVYQLVGPSLKWTKLSLGGSILVWEKLEEEWVPNKYSSRSLWIDSFERYRSTQSPSIFFSGCKVQ